MDRAIFALVNNDPEVLMRVAGFLRRVEFNIKSISMSENESDPSLAHLMIRTEEGNRNIERAIKNIGKFVNVHTVTEIKGDTIFHTKPGHGLFNEMILKSTGTNGIM